jgi:tRNA A-37 threonylcarbamoyl transferase component Bud32
MTLTVAAFSSFSDVWQSSWLGAGVHSLTVIAFYAATVSEVNICHRDLACRNILVAEGNVLKVSDFGMYFSLSSFEDASRFLPRILICDCALEF